MLVTSCSLQPDSASINMATATSDVASQEVSESGRMVSDGYAVTAGDAKTVESLQVDYLEPVAGPLVLVKFTSENIGNGTDGLLFSQFELTDAQGRTYSEVSDVAYTSWRYAEGYEAREKRYYPGEARIEIAAFQVAPDASGFTFGWEGQRVPVE